MWKSIDQNLLRDYLFTMISFVIGGLGSMLIYNQLPLNISAEGSEIFAVYKKTSSLLLVAVIGGMGVAIPKFTLESQDSEKSEVLLFGFLFSLGLCLISFILFLLFPSQLGKVIIGKTLLNKDILGIFSIIISGIFNACVYGYLRGLYEIRKANFMVIFVVFVQFISIFFAKNIYQYIYLSSLFVVIVSLIFMFGFTQFFKNLGTLKQIKNKRIKTLYFYGILRVPGDFSIDALTSLPVIFTTILLGISTGGQMGFAMTIFGLIMTLMSPINFILLPKASFLLNQDKNLTALKKMVFQSAVIVLPIVFISIAGVVFFSPMISKYIFHSSKPAMLNQYLIYVACSAIPYSIYSFLRGILDAAYKKPINSFNAMIALAIFVLSYYIFKDRQKNIVLWAMFCAYLSLAILTLWYYLKIFREKNA